GTDGVLRSDFKSDSLVGARVTTPGPDTQKQDGKGGLYGFPKIVDLDPNMQFRTELYGIRMYVDIEGGGGFSGELAVAPQLRDLWFGRGNGGIDGVQIAVGTWHQRLTNLTWTNPTAPSPVYDALRERSSAGLDVKIGVDLFQTFRADEFSVGNRFGYGRLVASIGAATADEPAQLVPGRRLYTPRTFDTELAQGAQSAPKRLGKFEFTRQAAEEGMNTAEALGDVATGADWNRTDFRVCDLQGGRSLLIMDLFNSAPLTTTEDGKFDTGGNVTVGWLDGTPLKNGAIAFNYSPPDADTRKLKDVFWPTDAAIFQIELTADERKKISNTPIAIQAGGTTVVRENTNGIYLNIERASVRLEPNQGAEFEVFSYEFGQPSAKLPAGLTLQTQLYDDGKQTANPTTIFSVSTPAFVRPGCFRMSLKTGPAQTLTPLRVPLDSFLCFLAASGSGYLVGEAMTLAPDTGPPTPPFLTLLFWQNHKVVDKPTWVPNIQPLMAMYARLFPGMKSILDISSLPTVTANAAVLKNRFERQRSDPGFMPVSRDMSPATVDMMLRFLDSLTKEQP
ncbi:MAG: hypothetical protein QOE82_2161, partial [Thermoanaerobaculia bacterium]|nr:hypothetical protein [Thermoanaerobaculia bacterium]